LFQLQNEWEATRARESLRTLLVQLSHCKWNKQNRYVSRKIKGFKSAFRRSFPNPPCTRVWTSLGTSALLGQSSSSSPTSFISADLSVSYVCLRFERQFLITKVHRHLKNIRVIFTQKNIKIFFWKVQRFYSDS
jgi:hypothetical protein